MDEILKALFGGVLIGIAASGMLLTHGRITGISGILAGSLFQQKNETSWRLMFLLGLMSGGVFLIWLGNFQFEGLANRSLFSVGIGGLLVGLGTNMGSGCTSGHGVCGVSRLSPRSIVATLTFMASGVLATYLIEHILGEI